MLSLLAVLETVFFHAHIKINGNRDYRTKIRRNANDSVNSIVFSC